MSLDINRPDLTVGVGKTPLGRQPFQGVDDAGLCLGGATGRSIEQECLDAALRRHLRDAASHGASADHTHGEIGTVDVETHGNSCYLAA